MCNYNCSKKEDKLSKNIKFVVAFQEIGEREREHMVPPLTLQHPLSHHCYPSVVLRFVIAVFRMVWDPLDLLLVPHHFG